jgi:segregation and condensation protein A
VSQSDLPLSAPGKKTSYRVQLPVFEGPLDLLLHLIEREELDITRVSLSLVTDQYLVYLNALDALNVDDLTDFVEVAARLLLIKSQALLPRPPTPNAQDAEDAGDELLRQLLAYKQFKQAAGRLMERHKQGQRSYVRVAPKPTIEAGIEHLEAVPLDALLAAARRAMEARPPTPRANGVVPTYATTINDQIDLITRELGRRARLRFSGLLTSSRSRQVIIVTLMAVLELIKQRRIRAQQERMFGEIVITPYSNPNETKS